MAWWWSLHFKQVKSPRLYWSSVHSTNPFEGFSWILLKDVREQPWIIISKVVILLIAIELLPEQCLLHCAQSFQNTVLFLSYPTSKWHVLVSGLVRLLYAQNNNFLFTETFLEIHNTCITFSVITTWLHTAIDNETRSLWHIRVYYVCASFCQSLQVFAWIYTDCFDLSLDTCIHQFCALIIPV